MIYISGCGIHSVAGRDGTREQERNGAAREAWCNLRGEMERHEADFFTPIAHNPLKSLDSKK
jgi:hypothetical protein